MKIHELINEAVAGPKNCWPGHRKVGTQPGTGKNKGKRVNDCEKIKEDEDIDEAEKKGLYHNVNKRKKAGTSRDASHPKAPTAQAWKDAAKTAKKEGVAEGWQEDSQELEDWSKEVNKRLYRAHENQRRSLAIQLSKLEQKHFGSELTNGPLTNIVFSTLQALNKGQMVHYDPQSVGQMPFGNIVGDDARIIAASGLSKYDVDGYRGLQRAGIVDTIQQFLHLRDLANNKGQAILKYANMPPVAAWMQFIKDIDWSKDDMEEGVAEGIDELARVLELSGLNLTADEQFDIIEEMVESLALEHGVDAETIWEDFESVDDEELFESAAWRNKSGKSKTGGLNAKGVASYRRENPGSKLQMAVTTKPSKLKPGSKAAKRRKSFCARMGGMKGPMKKPNGKPTRKALALRKWNC